ncbi:hypothetical protein DFQ28_004413 [Apophysomyces sp. BC1034]|nr:hypothetical protein DFQ28_004413 [Apophysomyces sp. BC1034]
MPDRNGECAGARHAHVPVDRARLCGRRGERDMVAGGNVGRRAARSGTSWMAGRRRESVLSSAYGHGMTLVEIVIALALVAIMATYALPTYREYMRRGMRVAAVNAVYHAAHYVEIQLAQRALSAGADTIGLPAGLSYAPPGGHAAYAIRVTGATQTNGGYSVIAEPLRDGLVGADDPCGAYRLDATGSRSNFSTSNRATGPRGLEGQAADRLQWREDARCWTG